MSTQRKRPYIPREQPRVKCLRRISNSQREENNGGKEKKKKKKVCRTEPACQKPDGGWKERGAEVEQTEAGLAAFAPKGAIVRPLRGQRRPPRRQPRTPRRHQRPSRRPRQKSCCQTSPPPRTPGSRPPCSTKRTRKWTTAPSGTAGCPSRRSGSRRTGRRCCRCCCCCESVYVPYCQHPEGYTSEDDARDSRVGLLRAGRSLHGRRAGTSAVCRERSDQPLRRPTESRELQVRTSRSPGRPSSAQQRQLRSRPGCTATRPAAASGRSAAGSGSCPSHPAGSHKSAGGCRRERGREG